MTVYHGNVPLGLLPGNRQPLGLLPGNRQEGIPLPRLNPKTLRVTDDAGRETIEHLRKALDVERRKASVAEIAAKQCLDEEWFKGWQGGIALGIVLGGAFVLLLQAWLP